MRARRAAIACALVAIACRGDHKTIQRAKDGGAAVAVVDRPVGGGTGSAVEVHYAAEAEPNDDRDHASSLPLGGGAQGTIAGDADVDVYKLSVPAAQMVAIQLDALDDTDLVLEVQNAMGEVVARSDRGPAKTSEGVPNLGLAKGDWFVVVRSFVKPKPRPKKKKGKDSAAPPDAAPAVVESAAYHLTAQTIAPADFTEREPDDDAGAAGELFPGDTVKGWIGWTGDVDVWKLSLEALGQRNAIDLDVSAVAGVALTVEVLDGTGKSVLVRKGARGGPVSIRSLLAAVAEGQPPFEYVKLSADKSNPVDPYALHVAARLLDLDEEAEPNDTIDHATPLRAAAAQSQDSGTMRASSSAGDVDWFGLDAASGEQILDVSVEAPEGGDVVVEAHGGDGALLARADAGGPGVREHLSGVTVPPNTAVRIKVEVKPDKKDTGLPHDYSLRWSISPAEGAPMPPEEPNDTGARDAH